MKKILILVLVVGLGFFYRYSVSKTKVQGEKTVAQPDVVLFVSQTCPHCQNVENYLQQNKINDQINIDIRQIYQQRENQQLLRETANKCPDLNTSQGIGVPLAYFPSTNSCLSGDTAIIDKLSQMVK